MSRRISSLDSTVVGIDRSTNSEYDTVKIVANEIDAVVAVGNNIDNVNTVADIATAITEVVGDRDNIATVAADIDNVNLVAAVDGDIATVSGISASVVTVAGITEDINTTAGIAADISSVAASVVDIQNAEENATAAKNWATYSEDSLVPEGNQVDEYSALHWAHKAEDSAGVASTIVPYVDSIEVLATDLQAEPSTLKTVIESADNINAVGSSISDVNTVAADTVNIGVAATNIADINTVATNIVSIQNTENNAIEAYNWAQYSEDVLVPEGNMVDEYSSYHYSKKAETSANSAAADVILTNADVVSTNADVVSTNADAAATAADRVQTGLDRVATGEDAAATAADRAQTAEDRVATGLDRVATGEDATATAADRVQTGLDSTATAADRVQTGLDVITTNDNVVITNGDVVTTQADAASTAADVLLTHADVVSSAASAAEALLSAQNASDSESIALSAVHFIGTWSTLTGGATVPASVFYNDAYWMLNTNLVDITSSEPGVSQDWELIQSVTAGVGSIDGVSASGSDIDLVASDNISITPNNTNKTISFSVPSDLTDLSLHTTDALPEGLTNQYYTAARASADAPVQSVQGYSGNVVLTSTDITTIVGLGVYEPADATILKESTIGVTVQAYDANLVSDNAYVHTDNNYTTDEVNKLADIEYNATADQTKEDIDALGINAATVNSLTVETSVPVGAVFTDTVYDDTDVVKAPGGVLPALDGSNLTNVSTVASINDLTDVDTATTAPNVDEALVWNGTNWVPGSVASDIAVIVQPATTSPIDGAAGVLLAPTIQFSPYYSLYGKPQQALQVQIATDDLFTAPIVDETLGAVSEYTTSNLDTTTQYYSRGRYQNDDGVWSEWSPVVSFTTADIYIEQPTITSPTSGATDIGETPTFTTDAFNCSNGTDIHASSSWYLYRTSDETLVWSSVEDTSNLESITLPAGVHDTSESYRLETIHTGTTYGDSTKGAVTYTTASSFGAVYGLNWDETNDTYLRTGDAASWTLPADFTNNNTVQAKMKRCVLNTDGTVNYFLFPTDSTLKEDGVTPSVLDGTDGNVMVQIPKFYYKYNYNTTTGVVHEHTISLSPISGGTVHPAFVQNGVEKDYRYYPAYQGSVVGGKLMSISGSYVDTNFTRATYRAHAAANGTGWHVTDWLLYEALVLLMITEYGTMNLQAALGEGRVRLSGGTWADGSYFGIHGNSNSDGNFSNNNTYVGDADDAAADLSYMTYRGCENVWGNIFLFLDGININNRVVYLNDNPATFADDTTTNYTDIGVTMGSANGYAVKLANSGKGFFPTDVTGGTDSTGTTDYYHQSTGWKVAYVGGTATSGLNAGPLSLRAGYASANLSVAVGAGVSF